MKNKIIITAWLVLLFLAASISAQSGGNFTVTESVIAGGGQSSAGGNFALDGTIGQAAAGGAVSNAPFAITSGFWNFSPLAPSAATASIGGRILAANGGGIRNVTITLTDISGAETRTARSSSFGYYRFEEIPVGETYILRVQSKRFSFQPDTRIITLTEELTELDFMALLQ